MLYLLLGAVGVFGVARLFPSAPAGAPAPALTTSRGVVPGSVVVADPGSPKPVTVPPWQRNTNIFFGGDPTAAASGDFGEFFSSLDPSTPGGRRNLGLFGWSDAVASAVTGHPEDIASVAKSAVGFFA